MREFNKLFVISLPRCATVSTCKALGLLGIKIAHLGKIHGELGDEHHHLARLQQMMDQIRAGIFRFDLLEQCRGLADYPACCWSVVQQLNVTYPNSLFINVKRDNSVTQWLQSVESQFVGLELLQESTKKSPEHQQFVEVMKQFRELTFGSQRFEAALYERAYFDYQHSIDQLFGNSDRLLAFNDLSQLGQEGFSRLCHFLELEGAGLGEFPCSNEHSSRPREAFLDALRQGKIRSQTGIVVG